MIFVVYLGHLGFHPVEVLVFSKSVFGRGLKLPKLKSLRKKMVHLYLRARGPRPPSWVGMFRRGICAVYWTHGVFPVEAGFF